MSKMDERMTRHLTVAGLLFMALLAACEPAARSESSAGGPRAVHDAGTRSRPWTAQEPFPDS